jgi:hypothetical protein
MWMRILVLYFSPLSLPLLQPSRLPLDVLIRLQFGIFWSLAQIAVLEGGQVPFLNSFRRISNQGNRSTFFIYLRDTVQIPPLSEKLVPLNLRVLIDIPGSFTFRNPDKKDDRPNLEISPAVAGQDVRYHANLSIVVTNTGTGHEIITDRFPVLKIIAYTRNHETPIRLCRKITCKWERGIGGESYPKYHVSDPFSHPFF